MNIKFSSKGSIRSISKSFKDASNQGRIALMPFLMAGDPDLDSTAQILLELQMSGADIIELGIPYSDPLADGPVIQAAASRAINSGTTPVKVLDMLATLKDKLFIPVIIFTYSNPLLSWGIETFCEDASKAGVKGLVVPDLPLEEAQIISPIAEAKGIDLILLVAPTTSPKRMRIISNASKGFTYLVSVTGVTGERAFLETRVSSLVKELKESSPIPVAVGFGISGPDQIRQVKGWGADGAIVGSALVNRISNADSGCSIKEAGIFCRQLREATG